MATEARLVGGERLRRARRGKKLKQSELATAVGVSQPTIWRWETGESEPDIDQRIALLAVLGTDPYAIEPAPSSAVLDSPSAAGGLGPSTEVPTAARAS